MSRRGRFVLTAFLTTLAMAAGMFGLLAYSQDAAQEAVLATDQDILAERGEEAQDMVTPKTQAAIDKGLAFLATFQAPGGGFGTAAYDGNVAITALAGLSFMSAGHLPGRGKYGPAVTRALEHVLSQEQAFDFMNRPTPGFLYHKSPNKKHHGAMYEHGFGTLFLAEAYGMVNDPDLRERLGATLKRAVKLIIDSQHNDGGWRYWPHSPDADLSVTVCQIMALRAAHNAGLTVPASVSKRCKDYVRACQRPNSGGSFQYMKHGGHISFPLTAAGVVALYSAGEYKDQAIADGLAYLNKYKPGPNAAFPDQMFQIHYFYGHYYATQAMWVVGGNFWKEWYPAIRDELLARQKANGAWQDNICQHYSTAMALIVLQMPNNYLPIFQR